MISQSRDQWHGAWGRFCVWGDKEVSATRHAALAKDAFKQGKTVRQLAHETVVGQKDVSGKVITKEHIDEYLNPWSMTLPGGEGAAGG